MTRKIRIKALALIVVMAMVAAAVPALGGCSLFFGGGNIYFTRSSLTLYVGDKYDLKKIIDTDTDAYGLSIEDASIAIISGHNLIAKAPGTTYVRAETDTTYDELRVTVKEQQESSLTLEAVGSLSQTVGETSEVFFVPTITGPEASSNVSWYVNDRLTETMSPSTPFGLRAESAGEYVVTARVGSLSASETLRVYYRVTNVTVEHSGALNQREPYAPVDFTVRADAGDKALFVEWIVDGEAVKSGSETSFRYEPTAGKHTLVCKVNGSKVCETDMSFEGALSLEAPTIDFDNRYPHVYIRYDALGTKAAIEITDLSGNVKVYSQNDSDHSHLFGDNCFDAGGLISLCAFGSTRRSYKFRVKSLGDGGTLKEGGYSPALNFMQLPSAAKQYIETMCLDQDLYITSEVEYVAVAEYYINFRDKTVRQPRVSFNCYIAYEQEGRDPAVDLWNNAFPLAATSGLYNDIRVSLAADGRVMSTSFRVTTVNAPTTESTQTLFGTMRAAQMHAILPHINFDISKYRPESYVFPIDRAEREVKVTHSDELFLAVQRGCKPLPTVGSNAETVYDRARDVLRKICTDDMTDVEKAHAIYDWIMWQVTYDGPATDEDSGGEELGAYYLEGVFGDGENPIGGVNYHAYAVCDGMSKAYSLLCNMEGIPCVRVIGTAGEDIESAGGHAWNKVFVQGGWYIVDCTWGDSQTVMSIDGGFPQPYELGLHDYLFLTDAEVADNHFEPFRADATSIVYAPATAATRLNVYRSIDFGGEKVNCYIARGENTLQRAREIAAAYAKTYKKMSSVTVPGGANGGVYDITRQSFEIYVEGGIDGLDSTLNAAITSQIKLKHPSAKVSVTAYNNIILVMIN